MHPLPTVMTAAPRGTWWVRLHRALMPDYNGQATTYWWFVVLCGAAILVYTLRTLQALPAADWVPVGIGAAIAMLAGFFPLRIPRSKNSFAAGEIFIFLLLLLHGPAAATLAAAGEGLIGSWRTSKRWTSRIASPAMACIAMFSTGSLLQAGMAAARTQGLYSPGLLLVATMLCAVLYFVFNTLLVTAVPHLKRSQWPVPRELFSNFGWIGITYAGSASIACLLFLTFQESGVGVLMAAVPIIAMLLSTLHYFFRQQAADETVRTGRLEAAERESQLASQHMRQLAVSERRFHSAFTHASIGMALLSFEGRVLQANAALSSLLGVEDAMLRKHSFQDFVVEADLAALSEQLARVNEHDFETFGLELRCRHRDGSQVWVAAHCSFFSEPGSTAPSLILQAQDISARRQAEAGLHQLAFNDSLTGLPNRRRFREHLAEAVRRAQADAGNRYAVMFLDFDRFKLINDSLGHSAGDEFLVQVSRRIQENVRPDDVVARLGGDEFAILLRHIDDEQDVITLADRLMATLRHPFMVAGTELSTSASIGITTSSFGYTSPEDVLRDADIAMYKAKAAGKARYALFDVGLHAEVTQRLRLEGDLRRAIKGGQLSVAYQPLFDLGTRVLTGFEALARWTHADHGVVGPRVHSDRRGVRADRPADRFRAAPRLPATEAMAALRPELRRADDSCKRRRQRPGPGRAGRPRHTRPCRVASACAAPDAGADREHPDGAARNRAAVARGIARAGDRPERR